jgi:hypothetical protein
MACPLCGQVFERRHDPRPPSSIPDRPEPQITRTRDRGDEAVFGLPLPWFMLLVGAVSGSLWLVLPFVSMVGWILGALVHELGHCAVSWLFGIPAIPALSLTGDAMTIPLGQSNWLLGLVWAGLGITAMRLENRRLRIIGLALVGAVYPLFALTPAREILVVLGGHLGELVFAILCIWRGMTRGFTQSYVERALYTSVGWYLMAANLSLTWGLLWSESSRLDYAQNGSFGLTNDYLYLSESLLGCSLQTIAVVMTFVALLVVPASLLVWKRMPSADRV